MRALFLFLLPLIGRAEAAPQLELFSPQGVVKQVRQVTARFPEPMVPFGDPRGLLEPFAFVCPAPGTARWADPRNWVFDFDRDLPAGVRCEFTLKEGLKTLSGAEFSGRRNFSFSTGGPAVRASRPYQGGEISEDQMFVLTLDAEPDPQSIAENVSFAIEGLPQRVDARIVTGEERERVLKAVGPDSYSSEDDDGPKPDPRPRLVLQARQAFPPATKVTLVWGKGVRTASGVALDQDQLSTFQSRPAFTATFSCERVEEDEGCLPIGAMQLRFSAPVAWERAKGVLLDDGKKKRRPAEPKRGDEEGEDSSFVQQVTFEGPFPPEARFRVLLPPKGLTDDAGRTLVNAGKFPLEVRTGDYPPLAKFSARFGVIELKGEPVLPFTVRNIEAAVATKLLKVDGGQTGGGGLLGQLRGRLFKVPPVERVARVLGWLDRAQRYEHEWNNSLFSDAGSEDVKSFAIPKPNGPKAFEVIGLPLKEPGLYVVELESRILGSALLGKPQPMFVPAAALVTNLSVHLKWGRESSVVWVTALDTGAPVPAAEVAVSDCKGAALWSGVTDAVGLARVPALPEPSKLPRCDELKGPMRSTKLFVSAKAGDDFSFVVDSWTEGIEAWRFQVPYEWQEGGTDRVHTILDRSLLRAGETVHMKHLLRRRAGSGFVVPSDRESPRTLIVRHIGSEQEYVTPLTFDAGGVAESTWEIPREAKLGEYSLSFKGDGEAGRWEGSTFLRVEEFRIPLLRASIAPPKAPMVGASSVPLALSVAYLSGGGAEGLPVKLRSQVRSKHSTAFDAFEGFSFGNGPAVERSRREGPGPREPELRAFELKLDPSGAGRVVVPDIPASKAPRELAAELEFRDPNGEVQTVSARVPLWPSGLLIGIKPDAWTTSKKSVKASLAVADLSGRPVAGVPVAASLLQRKLVSHRKRLAGGFYAYEHSERLVRLGAVCPGKTDARGLLACEAPSSVSGNVILQATVKDDAGRESTAHEDVWVADEGDWWFAQADNDRIDVLPERKRYEPGETATFQVRTPFADATALVTVEREGVLETFVRKLSRKNPVVRVPVRGHYAPNVFVSVLVVRGRVGDPRPTALVDLGRPAYKLGVGEILVGWKAHELKVEVSADREAYKVRERAKVKIRVRPADGKALPSGAEAAVAAVDEGLLELMPNKSWDILDAVMGRRATAVRTATAQMHVVGKRHYGLKALPPGGGGGRQSTRELFDTLLLWKARVPLNAAGEAQLDVPLNDSLTSFRIEAVAHAGAGSFGSGAAKIRSTQDLQLLSGLPPVVREGDRFQAGLTVRNATDRHMELEVSARAEGLGIALAPLAATVPPNGAQELSWDVSVPAGASALGWEFSAREGSGAEDRIKVSQKVVPAVPVRTLQATIAQVDGRLEAPVRFPPGATPRRGGVQVSFRPTLGGGLEGIAAYMGSYPYECLEQKISRAVALADVAAWNRAMAELPSYLDSDGLAKYFPTMEAGSDCLSSYVLSIAEEAGWPVPDGPRERMREGLTRFVEGKLRRASPLPAADLTLRRLSAIEALARGGHAQPGWLSTLAIEPNLWPTSSVLDWIGVLKRVEQAPDRARRLEEASQILRSRLNFQGTTLGFSTESSDELWWLMVSNDVNAVRVVLAHLDDPAWREDIPRLIRGAVGRQHRGHWDLTVANAWGRLSLEKFSKAFESTTVSGASHASLGGREENVDWSASPAGAALTLPWPADGGTVAVRHVGEGKPWTTVSSLAAVPLKEPLSSGYKIKKTWTAVERKTPGPKTGPPGPGSGPPGRWSRGDIARVRLELEAQADRTWVVVDDPIPAGASILGTGLGRDSSLATQGERRAGWVWPAFEERSFTAFRAYYELVPKGTWTVEYTLRLNNDGVFQLPPTRVEAMYSPEMFGELPNPPVEVAR